MDFSNIEVEPTAVEEDELFVENNINECKKSMEVTSPEIEAGGVLQYKPDIKTSPQDVLTNNSKVDSVQFFNRCASDLVDTHLDSKPDKARKMHLCTVCFKAFKFRCQLTAHMINHTNDKPFSCSVCSKSFSRKGNLSMHMNVHSVENTQICSVCSKSFNRSDNLRRHMRIHLDERPHSCSVCGKSFRRSSHLEEHLRIHNDERPFSCNVCAKSFKRKKNLRTHMKLHSR